MTKLPVFFGRVILYVHVSAAGPFAKSLHGMFIICWEFSVVSQFFLLLVLRRGGDGLSFLSPSLLGTLSVNMSSSLTEPLNFYRLGAK